MDTNMLIFALMLSVITLWVSFLCIGYWVFKFNINIPYLVIFVISLLMAIVMLFLVLFVLEPFGVAAMIAFFAFVLITCLAFWIFPVK